MRCLYCGKQLPLLKKLTGGGEFCAEGHRQKYQEEYNKLALSRLLQTQNADTDAPHRGELVLASRRPALLAGRPALRQLEAPKPIEVPSADPLHNDFRQPDRKPESLPLENWTPGLNRTQRALPPPLAQPPVSFQRSEPPHSSERPFPKPLDRNPLPQPLDNWGSQQSKTPSKRDAFSFQPIDPFPVAPPPVVQPEPEKPIAAAPADSAPAMETKPQPVPIALPPVAAEPKPAELPDPPEGTFIREEVRKPEPPPVPKLEAEAQQSFTDGRPPTTDGWSRWEPEIQGGSSGLESSGLLPLPEPPGPASEGELRTIEKEDQGTEDQGKEETRKKILENQVKPGDFKQTVQMAPVGPDTVLPICPPAAALDQMPATSKAKPPVGDPGLHLGPNQFGDALWMGWTLTGSGRLRSSLTVLRPDISWEMDDFSAESMTASFAGQGNATSLFGAKNSPSVNGKPSAATQVRPSGEPARHFRGAEALKSAAQNTIQQSAALAQNLRSDKPATPRYEVFVDLSVLGIEEDEDADAEFYAREGESPPGGFARKKMPLREATRNLISLLHSPAQPGVPKLAQAFPAVAWKPVAVHPRRRVNQPLRPRVVFERGKEIEPEMPKTAYVASAWSAKRLKKTESAKRLVAPGESGPVIGQSLAVQREGLEAEPNPKAAPATITDRKAEEPTPQPKPMLEVEVKPEPAAPVAAEANIEVKDAPPLPEAKPVKALAAPVVTATAPESKQGKDNKKGAQQLQLLSQPKKVDAAADKKPEPATINVAALPSVQPLPAKPPFEAPELGKGPGKNNSFWANLPVLPKLAVAAGLVAAIVGGAWMTLNPGATASQTVERGKKTINVGASMMVNVPGGWSPDWGGDFNRKKNRTISFYRPSANREDYRMEFEGQIDGKGLGWVFRAVDPKNYFAYKVEFVKAGPDPGVALTHFSVIEGIESQKHYTPVAKQIRPGVPFQVRLDVKGDEFSVYVNDELVEVWQDDHLPKGGLGSMYEPGETAQVRKLQIFELLP